jgi:extracellular elastinolytic metalloproteinase
VHSFGKPVLTASTPDQMLASLGCDFKIIDDYTSKHNGVRHVYFQQMINGIPVKNGVGAMNVAKTGKVVSFSQSFFKNPASVATAKATLSPDVAVKLTMQKIKAHKSDCASYVLPTLAYVQTAKGQLELTYRIECDLGDNWLESYVSADSGDVIAQTDYVDPVDEKAHSIITGLYSVYGIPDADPGYGPAIIAQGPDPGSFPPEAITLGWNDQGNRVTFTTTIGNNVYAQENHNGNSEWENNYRPDGGASLNFTKAYDLSLAPPVQPNLDNAIANLFYWNNLIHDIVYGYGFDEPAGNFQENNLGRGGREGDAVQANAQDGAGYNNANFATPADGSRGRMRMYIWNAFDPFRDGDIDAGIIYHEYGHGISNRLTGGPLATACLSGAASGGGMGEGWSDWFGKMIVLREGDTRDMIFPMGGYVSTNGEGIRFYPYTSNMDVNPLTLNDMAQTPYCKSVHAAGTIWCTVLWEVMWNLIEKYGWDANNFANGTGGNNVMTQLVIDGMKLQPCLPSMLEARDAIIMADELAYNGNNFCEIWKGFAKRGMGIGATGNFGGDFNMPLECGGSPTMPPTTPPPPSDECY